MEVAFRFLLPVASLLLATLLTSCALERELTFQPGIDRAAFGTPPPRGAEEMWFTTADGVPLHGWLLRSEQQPSRGAILYFHGNGGSVETYLPAAERLRRHRFDTMVWDYRGYGRSGGKPQDEAALYRDGNAAVKALAQRLASRPSSMAFFGYSLGTAVATQMALEHGCRALVLEAPIASLRSQVRDSVPFLPDALLRRMPDRFETVHKVSSVRCPLIVVHGDQDETVSLAQGLAVFQAARGRKILHIVPGGEHVMGERANWADIDAAAKFVASTAR